MKLLKPYIRTFEEFFTEILRPILSKMIPLNVRSHQNVFQESQEIGVHFIISLGSE